MRDLLSKYARMQKDFYDEKGFSVEEIVGNYDYHENFPYETHLLHLYGDIRKPVLADPSSAIGFDVGCGEGRMIRRMSRLLKRCDGADISKKMISAAKERTPGSNLFLASGSDCGDAPTSAYDFAFCTIALHHICVHDTRSSIIRDITRILKPDGCATLQFFFSRYYPYCRTAPPPVNEALLIDVHHFDRLQAGWFENRWDAAGTNSQCDAAFGTNDIPAVIEDFKQWFGEVHVWFFDISLGRPDDRGNGRPRILPEIHPNCHGLDNSWFSHMAFFHLRNPKKDMRFA
jgi:SAM-dependent methyltransferase